ncbi:LPD7 domain-containing protein [Ideonella sp. DXS29W]|uniref:LPD7 domain-containing protein n=1 Tax=Ideonella lacteola TaxID=2984193 RepID=A0ABU9BYR8_9BURK
MSQQPETPTPAADLPRLDFSNISPWLRERIERDRATSDRLNVTADIAGLAYERKTASEVVAALGPRLDPVVKIAKELQGDTATDATARLDFVRNVRVSMGVPSLDQRDEFDQWRAGVGARLGKAEPAVATVPVEAKAQTTDELAALRRATATQARHEAVAEDAQKRWAQLPTPSAEAPNPFLERTGTGAYGVRSDGDRLVIPARDVDGKLWSLFTVSPEEKGRVDFLANGRTRGLMHVIGSPSDGQTILATDRYETAATLHKATNLPVAVSFDMSNLSAVGETLKQKYPFSPLVIVGQDQHHITAPMPNPGVTKAFEAAERLGAYLSVPQFRDPAAGGHFNDLLRTEGVDVVRKQITELLVRPADDSRQAVAARFPDSAAYAYDRLLNPDAPAPRVVDRTATPEQAQATPRPEAVESPETTRRLGPAATPADDATAKNDVSMRKLILEAGDAAFALAQDSVGREQAQAWATSDVKALSAIQGADERSTALLSMGASAMHQVNYRQALQEAAPEAARLAAHAYMDSAATIAAKPQPEHWQDAQLVAMRDRHVDAMNFGMDKATPTALDTLARQDLITLRTLRDHRGQEEAAVLARDAMRFDAYREAFVSENDRLKLGVNVEAPMRQAQPNPDPEGDRQRREDVERRSTEFALLPANILSASAARELVALDVRALRETTDPQERLGIAFAMGTLADRHAPYRAAVTDRDPDLAAAVLQAKVARGTAEPEGTSNQPWMSAILNQGSADRERTAARLEQAPATEPNTITLLSREQLFDDLATTALRRRITQQLQASSGADSMAGETVGRMTGDELRGYSAAHGTSQVAGAQLLLAAKDRIEREADLRPGRRPTPPLEDRFNITQTVIGRRDYQFRDQPSQTAFREGWLSMKTEVNNPAAVKGMLDRAAERGWSTVRLTGDAEFKRQGWIAAEARGIYAIGYTPTEGDRVLARQERARLESAYSTNITPDRSAESLKQGVGRPLAPTTHSGPLMATRPLAVGEVVDPVTRARRPAANEPDTTLSASAAQASAGSRGSDPGFTEAVRRHLATAGVAADVASVVATEAAAQVRGVRTHVGTIKEIGAAPYEFNPKNDPSPFVLLSTGKEERYVWGVDLPRAIEASKAGVGDNVVLDHRGKEKVALPVEVKGPDGRTVKQDQVVDRNTWLAIRLPSPGQHQTIAEAATAAAVSRPSTERSAGTTGSLSAPQKPVLAPVDPTLAKAFETALDAKSVPASMRDQMRELLASRHAERQSAGQSFSVKVLDPTAERQRPPSVEPSRHAPAPQVTQTNGPAQPSQASEPPRRGLRPH